MLLSLSDRRKRCTLLLLLCFIMPLVLLAADRAIAEEPLFSFAALADHKYKREGLAVALAFIRSQEIDFVIVPGDFDPLEPAYKECYEKHGYGVHPGYPADRQNLYLVMGNHDLPPQGDAFFQSAIAPFYPRNGPLEAPLGTVYSFDRGNAHFVVTNQYIDTSWGGYTEKQLQWLQADLAATRQPFSFVFGHEPAFPIGAHVNNSLDADPDVRDRFWKILSDNQVQAFFCGHTHHLSVLRKEGVYQIDVGEAAYNHISLVTVHLYAAEAVVRLYETKRFEGDITPGTDLGTKDVFRMKIAQENPNPTGAETEPRVLFDSGVAPQGSSAASGCFLGVAASGPM
jgi:hypothetical protein